MIVRTPMRSSCGEAERSALRMRPFEAVAENQGQPGNEALGSRIFMKRAAGQDDLDRLVADHADYLGLCCRLAKLPHAEAIGHFIHPKVHFPWVWNGILGNRGDAC
jgi:hypothetical protein